MVLIHAVQSRSFGKPIAWVSCSIVKNFKLAAPKSRAMASNVSLESFKGCPGCQ